MAIAPRLRLFATYSRICPGGSRSLGAATAAPLLALGRLGSLSLRWLVSSELRANPCRLKMVFWEVRLSWPGHRILRCYISTVLIRSSLSFLTSLVIHPKCIVKASLFSTQGDVVFLLLHSLIISTLRHHDQPSHHFRRSARPRLYREQRCASSPRY